MLIDMTREIIGFDGNALMDEGHPLTIRDIIQRSIMAPVASDQTSGWEDKAKLAQLGFKAGTSDKADFSAEDISRLKRRIGEAMIPIVVGRAVEILDPPAT